MKQSIVEFTSIDFSEGKLSDEKIRICEEAIERLKRDLIYILMDFEERIKALENK